jgi:hypothetical protein
MSSLGSLAQIRPGALVAHDCILMQCHLYMYCCSFNANRPQKESGGGEDMTDPSAEDGVILALIDRFEKQRLPRLKELKVKTDRGERLSDSDIEFLDMVIHDAQKSKALIDRHPDWHAFCANVVHLYETITEKALENEKGL